MTNFKSWNDHSQRRIISHLPVVFNQARSNKLGNHSVPWQTWHKERMSQDTQHGRRNQVQMASLHDHVAPPSVVLINEIVLPLRPVGSSKVRRLHKATPTPLMVWVRGGLNAWLVVERLFDITVQHIPWDATGRTWRWMGSNCHKIDVGGRIPPSARKGNGWSII